MSYKIACKTRSDSEWAYNSVRFATETEAKDYGADLYSRWLGLDSYEIHPSDDAVNYAWLNGMHKRVEA